MKSERGSVTIVTLTAVLFMLAFLVSSYVIILNRAQVQAEIKRETKQIYENGVDDLDGVYESYFAPEDEIIPISNVEELLKVGTGEHLIINNKIYKCQLTSKYKLMNDITFNSQDYYEEYTDMFESIEGVIRWKTLQKIAGFTGTFNYNGKTITETDTNGNILTHSGT